MQILFTFSHIIKSLSLFILQLFEPLFNRPFEHFQIPFDTKFNGNYSYFFSLSVYISQLIRYARASSNYSDFLKCHLHLRNRLLDQGYKKIRLIRFFKKFIFQYQDLVEIYSVSAEKIINDGFSYSENV